MRSTITLLLVLACLLWHSTTAQEYKCTYEGERPSEAECSQYGDRGEDTAGCKSRGGTSMGCEECAKYANVKKDYCPVMCGYCDGPCDGLTCMHRGKLNRTTCQCSCPEYFSGDRCEIEEEIPVFVSKYNCSHIGKRPSAEQCLAHGDEGADMPYCASRGGKYGCEACTKYVDAKTDHCPVMCGFCDGPCDGFNCWNGGTLDRDTCTCSCPEFFSGEMCEVAHEMPVFVSKYNCTYKGNRPSVEECLEYGENGTDSVYCQSRGGQDFGCEQCTRYRNVKTDYCPVMCGYCDGLCDGLNCMNGGTIDRDTCTCSCPDYHSGQRCEIEEEIPVFVSKYNCTHKGRRPSAEECLQHGDKGGDQTRCASRGGELGCDACTKYVNAKTDVCPVMCGFCDGPCDGKNCMYGGILNRTTCECSCPDFHSGERCEVKEEIPMFVSKYNCTFYGRRPSPEECQEHGANGTDTSYCASRGGNVGCDDCAKYGNIKTDYCPVMCGFCDGPCDGFNCMNGGTLDRDTCTCSCPDYHSGQRCEIEEDIPVFISKYNCTHYGRRPSAEECLQHGDKGGDQTRCASRGGDLGCDACTKYVNAKTDVCPVMCGFCDAICDGKICMHGGTLNKTTCECSCSDYHSGDLCEIKEEIPVFVSKYNCTHIGKRPSVEECQTHGDNGVDRIHCASSGGQYGCDACAKYTDAKTDHCPIMCGLCDGPCDGKNCMHGGKLDKTTCECSCPPYYSGEMCEIKEEIPVFVSKYNCTYKGKRPSAEECKEHGDKGADTVHCASRGGQVGCDHCAKYSNINTDYCPVMCGFCDGPCDGFNCMNGGVLDRTTCKCSCPDYFAGERCEIKEEIPIFVSKYNCTYKGKRPSAAECAKYGDKGEDIVHCKSREGRKFDCDSCDYYADLKTSHCPVMCGTCDGPCDGKGCANGGKLDRQTCQCVCPPNYSGELCEHLTCPEKDPDHCGTQWPLSYCARYLNTLWICPHMCGRCG